MHSKIFDWDLGKFQLEELKSLLKEELLVKKKLVNEIDSLTTTIIGLKLEIEKRQEIALQASRSKRDSSSTECYDENL